LRCGKTPLARWGKKLLASKGSVNLAVAAIARKLTVAVWYLMMGRGQRWKNSTSVCSAKSAR